MEYLIPLFLFTFSTTITPGPNNIMILTSGLNFGIHPSLAHYWGIVIGFNLMVLLIGLGIGSLFQSYPSLHLVIRILGVGYLTFFAYITATAKPYDISPSRAKPFTFIQALLFQWINPKTWVMSTGAIAAFVSHENIFIDVIWVAFAFFIACLFCNGFWLCFGVFIQKILKKTLHRQIFNITLAVLLLLSMAPIFYSIINDLKTIPSF